MTDLTHDNPGRLRFFDKTNSGAAIHFLLANRMFTFLESWAKTHAHVLIIFLASSGE